MSVFNYQKDSDGIVTITMDMTGSVNIMNSQYSDVMGETVAMLENEDDITGVIFTSAKKTFFVGGDLNELVAWKSEQKYELFEKIEIEKSWLRRLEKLPVPVVAAINGAALGGGFEICLACNYRLAVNDKSVIVGLPEVTLGLLPGAGGVVRLTNMLGLEKALPLLLEGKRFTADKALSKGLVDQLVESADELVASAKIWILAQESETAFKQPWDIKGFKIPGGNIHSPAVTQVAQFSPYFLMKKTRGVLPAPERILETAVEAVRVDFDTALRIETRNFVSLVVSPVAKNMISTFFFQLNSVNSGASRPSGMMTSTVKKVGVIGAGMMGQGIANVSAMAGIEVVLKDISLEAAKKGKAYTEGLLDKAIKRGGADEVKKSAVLGLIKVTGDDADLAGCDLIIEAVFEDVDLKQNITKRCETQLINGGIWGTNTSTLPITTLAQAAEKPENFIGIHFFSPVDKMPLVELICGEKTSDATLAKAFDFVRQIRKTPIVVNDHVGFYTSRTFSAQLHEAAQMVAEGIHPARIDNLGKAIGMPVGPLTVHDEVSQKLTVGINNMQVSMGLKDMTDDPYAKGTTLLNNMVNNLELCGRHYGGGYYDYVGTDKIVNADILTIYHQPTFDIPDQDIKDRLLFSSVIESLRCLEEGVLESVADANIGSVMGIGAPTWTGGYIQFLNTYGLQKFIDRCQQLALLYGERFVAPNIVYKTLASGKNFQ